MDATMNRSRLVLIVVALVCAASFRAWAQQAPTEVPSEPIAGWTFRPGIAIGVMYDSNVAITSAPASTRTTPSDTLMTLDPVGAISYIGKRTNFDASYRGTFRHYAELDAFDGYDQHVGARVERRATKRFTVFGQNTYSRVPTTDELDIVGSTVPFRRAGSQHDQLGAGFSYRLTEFDTLSARYDMTWVAFDRQPPDLIGGFIQGVHSELSHAFNRRFSVGGEGGYRSAHMDQFEGGRDLRFVEVGGTMEYRLDEATKLTAGAGYAHLNDLLFQSQRGGLYVRGSLLRRAIRSLFGVSYERSFVPSFGFGGSNRSQEVRGWVDLPPIGRRVFTQASMTWRRTIPFEADALQLDTIQARATAGYAISRWMRAQGFYMYTRQDSIVTGGEINRSRIGGELVLSQPMRIR
jgi:hypothetical protein